jgi:hypothetical protein
MDAWMIECRNKLQELSIRRVMVLHFAGIGCILTKTGKLDDIETKTVSF